MPNDINMISGLINELCQEYVNKYGFTVFDITLEETPGDKLVITGKCLTKKQLDSFKRKVMKLNVQSGVVFDIDVIADDPSTLEAIQYGRAKRGIVDVFADHALKKLTTQISTADESFKVILRNENKYLIILEDKTLGWVPDSNVSLSQKREGEKDVKRLKKGETVTVASIDRLFSVADKYIDNVKYLLGGRSANGIDCSALIQLLFKEALDLVTPRHTLDQMKCGLRVSRAAIKSGDLLFAKLTGSNIMHVGLARFAGRMKIIHSCRREKRVIIENIEDFYERYSFAKLKRVVVLNEESGENI